MKKENKEKKKTRPIHVIADEIRKDWSKQKSGVSPYAQPYLNAMMRLDSMSDHYGLDSADNIVRYFLGNAGTWRGDTARRIKAELKAML